jgi:hypothetical protein
MSKSPKPPKTPPIPTPSDHPVDPNPEPRCWQFIPKEQSTISPKLRVGDAVFGTPIQSRIQVNGNFGFIGYAPATEAREMIEHTKGSRKRLIGQVLANAPNLLVQLCGI